MADIKITFDQVRDKAKQMNECNQKLDGTLETIKSSISQLEAEWTSDASDTIRRKIEGMQSKFDTYYSIINEYVNFLYTTVDAYETTEQSINSNAEQFI